MVYLATKCGIPVEAASGIAGVSDLKALVNTTPGMGMVNGNLYINGFAIIRSGYQHRAEEYYQARSALYWVDQLDVSRRCERNVPPVHGFSAYVDI